MQSHVYSTLCQCCAREDVLFTGLSGYIWLEFTLEKTIHRICLACDCPGWNTYINVLYLEETCINSVSSDYNDS